jgi:ferric-dicitrate binding protein FerR (iron transport regulator)
LNTDTKHIDNLIAKFLAGEITREEEAQLSAWLESAPDHEKYFGDLRFIHDKAIASHKVQRVNSEKAWALLQQKMDELPEKALVSRSRVNPFRKSWMAIAASVVVILGLSIYFFTYSAGHPRVIQSASVSSSDRIVEKTIDPHIQVVLNRSTHIQYTATRRSREVQLTGEAYFRVQHAEQPPLLVKAAGTLIEDIGTSFNVKALPEEDIVEVYVESGAVRFFTPSDKGIQLKAGETGRYQISTGAFSITETPDLNTISYKTKSFVFRNARLDEVIGALSGVYAEQIVLENPQLAGCTISVSFNREDIGTIMEIIAETLDLTLEKSDSGFVLKGAKCNSQ